MRTIVTIASFAALVLAVTEARASDFSKQARAFFEKVIDLKLRDDLLVLEVSSAGLAGDLHSTARGSFPGVERFSIRYRGGSSSSYGGGGGGSVSLSFEPSGKGGSFEFQLAAPDGRETMHLRQTEPGQLSVEYKSGKQSVSYSQAKGKCTLKIRAGADSMDIRKKSFTAVLQESPELTRKYLVGALEEYFDKAPVVQFAAAPPGKAAIHLKDGTFLVGELKTSEFTLETAYGRLVLPKKEVRQIIFPDAGAEKGGAEKVGGGETIVVTRRFSPRGKLEIEAFDLATQYGPLRVEVDQVLQIAVGPEVEGPQAGGPEGDGPDGGAGEAAKP